MDRKWTTVFGFLGTTRDSAAPPIRWSRWRPTIGLCMQEDFAVDRLELWSEARFAKLRATVEADIARVSPQTEVVWNTVPTRYDPWDFQAVYEHLYDFARNYDFADAGRSDSTAQHFLHITNGTHVSQICMFLLAESRHFPARLVQTSPVVGQQVYRTNAPDNVAGTIHIVDLDLSRYDQIASRHRVEQAEGVALLKGGIETRNPDFNRLIERIERVALASTDPILLTGPTGAGKSRIARRIRDIKLRRHRLEGEFVEVNCATLRGDQAASALFGHVKGAFTGAATARTGLLRSAHRGLLFLDEIGELGNDEQAMLLHALEEKRFLPLGADHVTESDFQLVAGTNRDLRAAVETGRFRDDLLARIDTWTFELPNLRDRADDIEPNVDYELERYSRSSGRKVAFNKEARAQFLALATSDRATWPGNFRDLIASVRRMATLAEGGRIRTHDVEEEAERLRCLWLPRSDPTPLARQALGDERIGDFDRFELVQLEDVLGVCRRSNSVAAAGRQLFAQSLARRRSSNDGDRLRKYLARFDLSFDEVRGQR